MMNSELWEHLGIGILQEAISSRSNYLRVARTIGFLLVLAIYFVSYRLFCFLTYPFTTVVPRTREVYENQFAAGFWTLCCYVLELNNVKVICVGDKLEPENALFISNHASLLDYIIFPFLTTKAVDIDTAKRTDKYVPGSEDALYAKDLSSLLLPKLKFFTWFQIWNLPTLSFWKNISQSDENWELDGETLGTTFNTYLNKQQGAQWLVTFPEVNMFTEKGWKMEQIMGEKYYLPKLQHVLYPRYSGFANCIGGLYKTEFNRIYDITIVYYQRDMKTGKLVSFKAPSLVEAFGMGTTETVAVVHVHGKLMNRVPLRRDKLERWLERRWVKKDKLVAKLRAQIEKEAVGQEEEEREK